MALTKVTGHVVLPTTNIEFHNTKSTGIVTFTDTTQSTSTTTGALQIAGGVGIAKNLNVGGNLNVTGNLTYTDVDNINSTGIITANAGIHLEDYIFHKGHTNTKLGFPESNRISLETGGTERVSITGAGVSITAGNPALRLHGTSSSFGDTAKIIASRDNDGSLITGSIVFDPVNAAGADIIFNTRDSNTVGERVRIKNDGKVGIGTDNPSRELTLYSPDSGSTYINLTNATTGTTTGDGFGIGLSGNEEAKLWNYENTEMQFGTNSTLHMYLKETGQLGIGTNFTPPSDAKKLTILCDSVGDGIWIANKENLYSAASTGYSDVRFTFYDYLTGGYTAGGEVNVRARSRNAYASSRTTDLDFLVSPPGGTGIGVTAVRIQADAKLGVGMIADQKSSLKGKVDIDGSTQYLTSSTVGVNTSSNYAIVIRNPSTTDTANGIAWTNDSGANVGGAIIHIDKGSNNIGDLAFYTSASTNTPLERLRITRTGQFVVGTNPTVNSGNIAHIEAPTGFNNGETIVEIAGDNSAAGPRLTLRNRKNSANTSCEILGSDSGGQSTGSVRFYHTDQDNNYGDIALGTRNASGPPVDRLRIDKDGRVIVGGGTHAGGSALVVKGGNQNTYSTIGMFSNHTNPGANTLLSQIRFGSNTSAVGADIRVYADAAWGNNDYPSRISIWTAADGSNSRTEKFSIDSTGLLKSMGRGAIFEQVETNQYNSSWTAANGKISVKGDLSGGNYFGWREKGVAAGSVTQTNAQKKLPTVNDFTYPNTSNGMLLASTSKIGFAASGESPQYSSGVTMLFDSSGLALGGTRAFDCNDSVSGATTARIKLFSANGQIGLNLDSMSHSKTKLEVRSNTQDVPSTGLVYFKVDQDSNNPVLRIDNASGGNSNETHGLLIKNTAAGYGLRVDADGSGGNPFIVDSAGDVRIGRETDLGGGLDIFDKKLILSKTGTGTRNWAFINNNIAAGNLGIVVSSATDGNSWQNRFEIDPNGQVCIGNPAIDPTHRLVLQDSTTGDVDTLFLRNTNVSSRNTTNLIFGPSNGVATVRIGGWASDDASTTAKRDGHFYVETRDSGTFREHFRVSNTGKIIMATNTSQGTTYEDDWNGSHGQNVFNSFINYKHYVGFNQYSWYKYTAAAGSSSRPQWVNFKLMWSTGHASGVACWDFSVITRNPHGSSIAYVERCVLNHNFYASGSYYGWTSTPRVTVYSASDSGSSAGFYLRVEGHGDHNSSGFNMHTMHSWHILAFDNQYESINNSQFAFVSNDSGGPSGASSAQSWNTPDTSAP